MLFSELKNKEVINVKDCKRIGHVVDFEFDHCNGCIKKLIISNGGFLCSIFKPEGDCIICFNQIQQIGPDIILVDICC